MTEHYIYIQNDESNDYFSDNHVYKFKVHLNTPLTLHGVWKVALVQFTVLEKTKSKANEALYIYSNICDQSIVHGREKSLLRRLEKNKKSEWSYILNVSFYLPVRKTEFREFEIIIKLGDDSYATYLKPPLNGIICAYTRYLWAF